MLLGLLQLALRHPGNTGATAEFGRKLAVQLQEHVAVTPALRAVGERRWRPAHDEPANAFSGAH